MRYQLTKLYLPNKACRKQLEQAEGSRFIQAQLKMLLMLAPFSSDKDVPPGILNAAVSHSYLRDQAMSIVRTYEYSQGGTPKPTSGVSCKITALPTGRLRLCPLPTFKALTTVCKCQVPESFIYCQLKPVGALLSLQTKCPVQEYLVWLYSKK